MSVEDKDPTIVHEAVDQAEQLEGIEAQQLDSAQQALVGEVLPDMVEISPEEGDVANNGEATELTRDKVVYKWDALIEEGHDPNELFDILSIENLMYKDGGLDVEKFLQSGVDAQKIVDKLRKAPSTNILFSNVKELQNAGAQITADELLDGLDIGSSSDMKRLIPVLMNQGASINKVVELTVGVYTSGPEYRGAPVAARPQSIPDDVVEDLVAAGADRASLVSRLKFVA